MALCAGGKVADDVAGRIVVGALCYDRAVSSHHAVVALVVLHIVVDAVQDAFCESDVSARESVHLCLTVLEDHLPGIILLRGGLDHGLRGRSVLRMDGAQLPSVGSIDVLDVAVPTHVISHSKVFQLLQLTSQ